MALSPEVSGDPSKIAASRAAGGQDNGTAMQLGNLLFQPVFSSGAITDQYRNLVFNIGSDVSDSAVSLKQHEALAQQLDLRRQSVSGVSIDEETVQILQFQRAYQASARLIKTVDELTQTLLNL
jgi:flagellar hook-associated protein 1 FlgK